MTTLYVLDVPENVPLPKVAAEDPAVTVGRIGPYFVISAPGPIVIDRRATGCRHASWYSVVALMHPRQDVTHHPLVPMLLRTGAAVWTQHTRSVNNDLTLVHEQALLDVAAGMVFLRDRFASVVTLGHSGGGPLYAFYLEQAARHPAARIATTPGGRPTGLAEAELPLADGAVFLAPHPGQGKLLLACIDPSVADEADPLSVRPELDPFDPANGFAEPPASSSYAAEFLARYRAAQRARVARIDAVARAHLARAAEARAAFKAGGGAVDRRRSLAPKIITVFRTDADPRNVDLSIDPSDRPVRFALRQATGPHRLRPGRLRTPDDARGVALDLVGPVVQRRVRAVRPRRHRALRARATCFSLRPSRQW